MSEPAGSPLSASTAIHRLVTFAHVADVDASIDFYANLGFKPENRLRDHLGRTFWSLLQSDGAEIMFARASGPIVPDQQAVLFYAYSRDVATLRAHLLALGIPQADGQPPADGRRNAVFEMTRPAYMPAGEFRIADPDGYSILVGQLGDP